VAALFSEDLDVEDETVVPILSGGNIDISMLQTVLTQALTERSQLLRLRIRIEDEPGEMTTLSGIIADTGANIRTVRHDRAVDDLRVGEAYLVFQVVTNGSGHAEKIIEKVRDAGYEVERVA